MCVEISTVKILKCFYHTSVISKEETQMMKAKYFRQKEFTIKQNLRVREVTAGRGELDGEGEREI